MTVSLRSGLLHSRWKYWWKCHYRDFIWRVLRLGMALAAQYFNKSKLSNHRIGAYVTSHHQRDCCSSRTIGTSSAVQGRIHDLQIQSSVERHAPTVNKQTQLFERHGVATTIWAMNPLLFLSGDKIMTGSKTYPFLQYYIQCGQILTKNRFTRHWEVRVKYNIHKYHIGKGFLHYKEFPRHL